MHGPVRAMVADPHTAVRTGLRDFLATDRGLVVVAEASDASETLRLVARKRPDVLVLDIQMPGMGCVDVIRESKAAYPAVRILVLAILGDAPYAYALLRAGADGCLSKNIDCDQLVRAVKRTARGERVLDAVVVSGSARQPDFLQPAPDESGRLPSHRA